MCIVKSLLFFFLITIPTFMAYSNDLRTVPYEYFGLYDLEMHDYWKRQYYSKKEPGYVLVTLTGLTLISAAAKVFKKDEPPKRESGYIHYAFIASTIFLFSAYTSAYTMTQPYRGSQSITSIEVSEKSKWVITGTKVISGKKIDLSFFSDPEKKEMLISSGMFDLTENEFGRFVMFQQCDCFKIFIFPSDFSIDFHNYELKKTITIRFQRKATTPVKSGKIIYHLVKTEDDINVEITPIYASFFDMESWHRKPARVLVEITDKQGHCNSKECEI